MKQWNLSDDPVTVVMLGAVVTKLLMMTTMMVMVAQVPAESDGPVVARGLPQMFLLRLPFGGGGLHALCQGQPAAVP